jgi:phage baseplate assembly protein W
VPNLADPRYLKFPFRIGRDGPESSSRAEHVREQIEQVLFTDPGERVFHPELGVGLRSLLFEPNAPALRELTQKRLLASLADALQGEVDPRTLEIEVNPEGEQLKIRVAYALAAIGHRESHAIAIGPGSNGGSENG